MVTTARTARSGDQRLAELRPLLTSISREIEERSDALRALAEQLGVARRSGSAKRVELEAQRAEHRRELRHVLSELRELGCVLLSTRPCVFFLLAGTGDQATFHFWRAPGGESEPKG